jgi:hypothetical protein
VGLAVVLYDRLVTTSLWVSGSDVWWCMVVGSVMFFRRPQMFCCEGLQVIDFK